MEIPYQELKQDTLESLIEEFVSREGTDYGLTMYSLEQKVQHVISQLKNGKASIVYDAETSSCNIVLK